jgi:hypothetical protein
MALSRRPPATNRPRHCGIPTQHRKQCQCGGRNWRMGAVWRAHVMQIRSDHLIKKVIRSILYDYILCEIFYQKLGLHFLWEGVSSTSGWGREM